jgi:hypothetical protein
MSADTNESVDGELIRDGVVVPFERRPEIAQSEQDEPESEQSRARGPELSTMRQILNTQKSVYRMVHRGEISSAEGERRTKMLNTMFTELQFLDFEKDISERLLRLEENRGGGMLE